MPTNVVMKLRRGTKSTTLSNAKKSIYRSSWDAEMIKTKLLAWAKIRSIRDSLWKSKNSFYISFVLFIYLYIIIRFMKYFTYNEQNNE